ncbi:MAG: PIN domain-containing protein [Egibacteraceae bacterium]
MASSRRRRRESAPERLILDSGAVIGLARGDQRARAFLERARELDVEVEIPVVVVAETACGQGPRAARLNRVLRAIDAIPPATEEIGRLAGSLLNQASSSATIDAMVVAQAIAAGGAAILTGDPADLAVLASAHPEVTIQEL